MTAKEHKAFIDNIQQIIAYSLISDRLTLTPTALSIH